MEIQAVSTQIGIGVQRQLDWKSNEDYCAELPGPSRGSLRYSLCSIRKPS
jgi:hypothetical protein